MTTPKLHYNLWKKEQTFVNSPSSSRRTSVSFSTNDFDNVQYVTIFNFIDWPLYSPNHLIRIDVAHDQKGLFGGDTITLQYLRGKKEQVLFHGKNKEGTQKYMSIVTFDSFDLFEVVEMIVNSFHVENPDGFVFRHFKLPSWSDWEIKRTKDPTFVTWSVLKYETITIANVSLTIDHPQDIPSSSLAYFTLR